jgi:hypothetical protein
LTEGSVVMLRHASAANGSVMMRDEFIGNQDRRSPFRQ